MRACRLSFFCIVLKIKFYDEGSTIHAVVAKATSTSDLSVSFSRRKVIIVQYDRKTLTVIRTTLKRCTLLTWKENLESEVHFPAVD